MMDSDITNFDYRGSLDGERSIYRAVRTVLNEGDGDLDALANQAAYLIAAILETLPTPEVVRVLNAASLHTWEAVEHR
jgi:hypothetical protein